MKTISKIIFAMITLMCITSAQVPLLNRVGTTIYPWRPGDKFSDSLLSSNTALLNKNNIFTGTVNAFSAINSGAITATGISVFDSIRVNGISYLNSVILTNALDTAYSSAVSNVLSTLPLTIATSGKTKFISLHKASVSDSGYISSTDWATFNAKQPTLFLRNATAGQSQIISTNTANDSILAPLLDKGGQVFNVKAYGAKGDGVTDDASAIQSTIAAATSGGTVFIPQGTYNVSRSIYLKSNLTLAGVGTASILKSASKDTNIVRLIGYSNIVIRDLQFYGANGRRTNDESRVYGNGVRSTSITQGGGPNSDGCKNILIQNCYFTRVNNGIMDDNGTNIRVLDNTFFIDHDSAFTAVQFRGTAYSIIARNYMENTIPNTLRPAINAVWLYNGENAAVGLTVSDNIMKGFDAVGLETIVAFIQSASITNNKILGNSWSNGVGATSNHRAIDITSNPNTPNDRIIVANNTIRISGVGIRVKGLSSDVTKYITVSTNTIDSVSMVGILLSDLNQSSSVFGNKITNVSDLGNANLTFGCGIVVEQSYRTEISLNTISNVSKDGIHVWSSPHYSLSITHNQISKAALKGMFISGLVGDYVKDITVSDNQVDSCNSDGISLNQYFNNVTVQNNTIYDCGLTDDGTTPNRAYGIVLGIVGRALVTGNTVFTSRPDTMQSYALRLSTVDTAYVYLNNFWRNRTGAISINGSETNLHIWNNIGENRNLTISGKLTADSLALTSPLDTTYSNSVSNVIVTAPLSVATSGKTKFLSLSNLGSMYYVDSTKYHGSASINTVGALASGSIAPGFGSINIGGNTINSGAITSTGQISGTTLRASAENIYIGSVTNVYRIDNLGSAGYEWRFLSSGNSINGITINGISQSGTAVNSFLGNVGIGTTSPSSTARLSIKAGLTTNIQEWYRSASGTAVASIDTNGSVLFNNTSNTTARFYWDAAANGNAGVLSLSYLTADRVSQKGTDLQVGAPSTNGSIYIISGTSSIGSIQLSNSNSSFTSTGYVGIKASNSRPNAQEWYRSASGTAVASIDTNGSVLFNNTANVSTRFYWDATANGGAGGLLLSYLYVDRLAQKATDLQVGSVTASGGTYFIAGLGNNSNNAFTFSSPSNGTGVSVSNTGYLNIKATNQRLNIQEWYRSSSSSPVALVDTTGIGQFARLKIGGATFARIDSAKIVGDTLKYYVNGVAYNSVRGSKFSSLSFFFLLGAGLWFCFKKIPRVNLQGFTSCREIYFGGMIFLSTIIISGIALSQSNPSPLKENSARDSTLTLSIEKFDARLQELQGELEKQVKTKDQAQKVLQQTEDNIKALQSAIQAMMMVKQDTTLHIRHNNQNNGNGTLKKR